MPNEPARLWKEIVDTYVDADELQEAFCTVVPWEEWFHVASHLEQALSDAGLTAVRSTTREYTIEIAPTDYISMKQAGVEGRLIRRLAGESPGMPSRGTSTPNSDSASHTSSLSSVT